MQPRPDQAVRNPGDRGDWLVAVVAVFVVLALLFVLGSVAP